MQLMRILSRTSAGFTENQYFPITHKGGPYFLSGKRLV